MAKILCGLLGQHLGMEQVATNVDVLDLSPLTRAPLYNQRSVFPRRNGRQITRRGGSGDTGGIGQHNREDRAVDQTRQARRIVGQQHHAIDDEAFGCGRGQALA
jgi:hypothetical protein